MRKIKADKITKAVVGLVKRANFSLRSDVLSVLRKAYRVEKNKKAKIMLKAILNNAAFAKKENLAICQDTGLPIIFVQLGQDLKIEGDLKSAINKGIEAGYKKYSLRNSVINDPLLRGTPKSLPPIMHIDLVKGNKIKLSLLAKGFGCENKSQLKMFIPTAGIEEIKKFIVQAVKAAGCDACPPYFIGVGIGGSADYSGLLAKKALLDKISVKNSKLEADLLKKINKLNIGAMGLGGQASALAIKIQKHPTHIAGLPVSVNINCHALRSAEIVL